MNTLNMPIPKNEEKRLEALQQYDILDSLSEKEFDRITELASLICNVPISLISFIDKDRQWLKSSLGFNMLETKRSSSFCQYTIIEESIFEVEDATKDERFKNNEFVTGDTNFKFYAGYPLIDNDGFALGSICVIDNQPKSLTENQKKSLKILAQEVIQLLNERLLQKELQNFEKIFNLSNDMIAIAGFEGYLKKINPAFTTLLGWDTQTLLNTPYIELLHPDDVAPTLKELGNLLNGEQTINFTNRLKTKDNQYKIIQWMNTPNLKNKHIYAIGRDITMIKAYEQKLAFSEKELKIFIESSQALLFTTDFKGSFLSGNQAFYDQTGYSKEEMAQLGLSAITVKEGLEERLNKFYEALLKDGTAKNEGIIKNKNGSLMQLTYTSSLVKNPMGEDYIIVNAIDTTKRLELEENLKETKKSLENLSTKLQKQNDKLLNFAHITSHNLRAPVSNLNTLIYFYNQSNDDEDRKLLFTKLETVNDHLTSTLNDLVESLKIHEDLEIEHQEVSFNSILTKTKEILIAQIITSNAIITHDFSQIDTFYYPKNYLESIVLNLFTNALKYASPNRIPAIHFESKMSNKQIVLTVSDNGLGIDMKKNGQKLFGLNKTFHKHPDAKGVGLFIVKTQIEAMGGEISAESEVDKGTTFKIIFNKYKND